MALLPIHVRVVRAENRSVYSTAKCKVGSIQHEAHSTRISVFVHSVSKPAPMFEGISVMNGEFAEISLRDFKNKYLVLLFYPLDL